MTDDNVKLPDIKPHTPISTLNREEYNDKNDIFKIDKVSVAVGMSQTFIKKVCGSGKLLSASDVLQLLDQDAYRETIIPRSKVLEYLKSQNREYHHSIDIDFNGTYKLICGDVIQTINKFPSDSIKCIVTSTPYWGLRVYKEPYYSTWSDGEICPYGHEQTPEGFVRHTTEVLSELYRILKNDGSIWWNLMDSFNTRTQIRNNAVEALRAMQGKEKRSWTEYQCRRYSAGHSYLKDGEQCLIPAMVAERASRIGFYVKTIITWAKSSSLPEPQNSRVSRNIEYIIHLTKQRTPFFNKKVYRQLPAALGGRNNEYEADKLSDIWTLPTASGRDDHGAQFPISLPGRCIALSTEENDLVLDPFVGAGNAGIAAISLSRRFVGIDVCQQYIDTAKKRLSETVSVPMDEIIKQNFPQSIQGTLL